MMLDRDGYPPGVPCWIDTSQPDPAAATEFYGSLFGWDFEERAWRGPAPYFIGRLRGRDVAGVGGRPDDVPPTSAWTTYVWVADADLAAGKVRDAGGSVLLDLVDVPGAGRMGMFADTSGAAFGVWQAREHRGAQAVNEPGSWNFSELNTPDPEGTTTFYGSVFGWELSELDVDGDGSASSGCPATVSSSRAGTRTSTNVREPSAPRRGSRTRSLGWCPSRTRIRIRPPPTGASRSPSTMPMRSPTEPGTSEEPCSSRPWMLRGSG
jgi:predicted enzyme related to lactoylglutathione lyase